MIPVSDVINSNPMMAMQGQRVAMEQMEPMMQKFMDGMGGTVQMSSSISYPLTADSMGTIYAVDSKNAKSFTDTLSEMAPQMGFEPRDFQGHQIYSMETGGMMPGMPSEMAVAVGGGEIYMGGMSCVEQALRTIGSNDASESRWPPASSQSNRCSRPIPSSTGPSRISDVQWRLRARSP